MKKISYKIAMSIFLLVGFSLNLQAVSQIKIICDMNGEEIYLNGKFKSSCDKDEVVRLLAQPGKYRVVIKKSTKEGKYSYIKNIRLGDGIQKTVVVEAKPVYSEYHYYKQAVDQESLGACNDYKERYPHGKYLRGVKELEAYIAAKKDFKNVARYEKLYPNGKYLSKIRSYYIKNPLIATLKGHKGEVETLALRSDGKRLYSGGADDKLIEWDPNGYKMLKKMSYDTSHGGTIGLYTIALSPDNIHALTDGRSALREWDLRSGKNHIIPKVRQPEKAYYLDKDTALLFRGDFFQIYDLKNKKSLYKFVGNKGYDASMNASTLSKDKRYLFFSIYSEKLREYIIYLFDLKNRKIIKTYKSKYLKDSPYSLAVTSDMKYLISGTDNGSNSMSHSKHDDTLLIWDVNSAKPIKRLKQKGDVDCIAISPDEKLFASGSTDGNIKIWDLKSGALLKKIYTSGSVNDLAFSKDGKRLFSAQDRGGIKVWYMGYFNKHNILNSYLQSCKQGDVKACNDYLLFGGKQKRVAKNSILHSISAVLKRYGGKMARGDKKVYVSDKENYDHFKGGGNYSKYTVKAIATSGNKTYVLMNMHFYNTGFTFNSPIYLVQNGKKKNYSKKYPADKYFGFKRGQRGEKDVKVVFVFDNFPLSKGRYRLIENTGTCNGCLNCDKGNIVKIF